MLLEYRATENYWVSRFSSALKEKVYLYVWSLIPTSSQPILMGKGFAQDHREHLRHVQSALVPF